MSTVKYVVGNFSKHDYSVLKHVISVVDVQTKANWEEASEADADVTFLGMDEPGGESIWDRTTDAVRVWCSHADNDEAEWVLKLPARPVPLLQLLRKLEVAVASSADAAASGGEPATRDAVNRGRGVSSGAAFRPADGILGYLHEILESGIQAVLHARSDDPTFPPPELLVDGAERQFFWAGNDAELAGLCAMPADGIRGRKARDDEYRRHTGGLAARPLAQLLWLAALYGSAGAPMEGLTGGSTVRLDAGVGNAGIQLAPEERKLERLLIDGSHTVSELVRESGLPEKQVFAFINGGLALGIAQLEQNEGG